MNNLYIKPQIENKKKNSRAKIMVIDYWFPANLISNISANER
jgi:hypothetical protein